MHWGVHFKHNKASPDSVKSNNPEEREKELCKATLLKCTQCTFTARLSFALIIRIKKVHNIKENDDNIRETALESVCKELEEGRQTKLMKQCVRPIKLADCNNSHGHICEVRAYEAKGNSDLNLHVKQFHLDIKPDKKKFFKLLRM